MDRRHEKLSRELEQAITMCDSFLRSNTSSAALSHLEPHFRSILHQLQQAKNERESLFRELHHVLYVKWRQTPSSMPYVHAIECMRVFVSNVVAYENAWKSVTASVILKDEGIKRGLERQQKFLALKQQEANLAIE